MKTSPLFGPPEGWSLEPVGRWLLTEGRSQANPVALVDALMAELDRAGANIDRLRLTMTTLHPQVLAWGIFWDRDVGARPWSAQHGVENADAYIGSPNQFVRDQRQAYRQRLDTLPVPREHETGPCAGWVRSTCAA